MVHKLEDLSVAPSASMLHLTRGGRMLPGTIDQDDVEWVSFASEVNESFYEPGTNCIKIGLPGKLILWKSYSLENST